MHWIPRIIYPGIQLPRNYHNNPLEIIDTFMYFSIINKFILIYMKLYTLI